MKNMPPTAIAKELGQRLKQARLNANLSQEAVAHQAGISRNALLNAERGHVQFTSFIAVMAALKLTGQLDLFLPAQEVSPIQLAKMQGKKRVRASKEKPASYSVNPKEALAW